MGSWYGCIRTETACPGKRISPDRPSQLRKVADLFVSGFRQPGEAAPATGPNVYRPEFFRACFFT